MNPNKPSPDPATSRPWVDEADIGSGEKSPGHAETEEMIRQIPPLPPSGAGDAANKNKPETNQGGDAGNAVRR